MRIDHIAYQRASSVSVLGLFLQLVMGLLLLIYGRSAGDVAFEVASLFALATMPVWIVLAVVFHQHRLERLESMEREDLITARGDATIFERSTGEQDAAARRLRMMHQWLVPSGSLLVAALLAGFGYFNWTRLAAMQDPGPEGPVFAVGTSLGWQLAMCLAISLAAFIFARFVAGMSQQPAWQSLRGGAGMMVGVALMALATAVGIVFHVFQRTEAIEWVARGLAVVQMAVAAEILLNWILNLYRPRRVGEMPRPAFDSRVLGLLAAPDNLVRSMNEAVNYQFGFDITSSWGYKLLLRSVGGLAALCVVSLVLLSCLVVVGPGQQAVRLRGGSISGRVHQGEILWKLPWPFETAEVVDIAQIRALPLYPMKAKVNKVNLWTDSAGDEERRPYIVAAPRLTEEIRNDFGPGSAAGGADPITAAGSTSAAASVESQLQGISDRFALVEADLVLNWRVREDGLLAWLNFASDARIRRVGLQTREAVLREFARREVCQLLSTQPLDQVLSPTGTLLATLIRERLQKTFDAQDMGVEVVSIQIPLLRPPGEAAPMYEEFSIDVQNARKDREEAQRRVGDSMAKLLGDSRMAEPVVSAIDAWRTLRREKGELDPLTVQQRQRVEQLLLESRGLIATQIRQARARRWEQHLVARGTASEVLGQAGAFHAAPELFMERRIMEVMSQGLSGVRQKYVLGVDPAKVRFDIQMQQADSGLNLGDYLEKKNP